LGAISLSDTTVYLREGVKIEPLMHGWHAWAHLIGPVQHGLNTAFRHVPIMKSFVANPAVHVAACKNPALAGGPFIDLPASDVPRVKAHLEATAKACDAIMELAKDYVAFDQNLQTADGFSLNERYDALPPSMRGLVELHYDLNAHPKIRWFEGLLDGAGLNEHLEQLSITTSSDVGRPFFLSTPRLHGEQTLNLRFSDPIVDTLAKARLSGAPGAHLEAALGLERGGEAWNALTTSTAPTLPAPQPAPTEGEVRVTYFGHACVLLESAQSTVLLDPALSWERYAPDAPLSMRDLPGRLDYLVISHGHHDHFSPEMLLQLRWRAGRVLVPAANSGSVADPSMKRMLARLGYADVRALEPLEDEPLADGRILSLPFPGEHSDLDIFSKQSVLVELAGKRFLFLVDSDAVDLRLYDRIAARIGPIDALFLGMECGGAPLSWLYGPLLSRPLPRRQDESRRLSASDADKAIEVVRRLKPAMTYVYAMGQESFVSHLTGLAYEEDSIQLQQMRRFLDLCQNEGWAAAQLFGARRWTA